MDTVKKKKRVERILNFMYRAYGSNSGHLFGLPPEQKDVIRTIIELTLEKNEEIERDPTGS